MKFQVKDNIVKPKSKLYTIKDGFEDVDRIYGLVSEKANRLKDRENKKPLHCCKCKKAPTKWLYAWVCDEHYQHDSKKLTKLMGGDFLCM